LVKCDTVRLVPSGDAARIELPTPFRIGTVNAFLLDGQPLTLVDTGPRWAPSLEALEHGLAEHGRRIEDLELVLLTHQHCDHVGLAATVRRRSGARIAAVASLGTVLADYEGSVAAEDDFAVEVMHRYGVEQAAIDAIYRLSKSYWEYGESVEVDETLVEGDEIRAGDRRLRVLARPGHSPTDTIFLHEPLALAFTGDHLLPRVSSNPVIHRPPGKGGIEERGSTLASYLDSLQKTAALELASIQPGHGAPDGDPRDLIAARFRHHEERKETIAGLIAEGSVTVPALAATLWGDIDDSQIYLAVSEVIGHTDLLIAEGRIRERMRAGTVVFEAGSAH
jgi:glyoxylase-like metal-dependent hydrolase (beta-lactamase superfamily II)